MPINLPDNRLFPEFSLPDLSGREISVKNYSGKRLIIFIWASWWACREQLPVWQRFYESEIAKEKEIDLISVAIDVQGPKVVKPYVDKVNPSFVTVVDEENALGRSCGFKTVPNGYLVEPDMTVSYSNLGEFDIRRPDIVNKIQKWIKLPRDSNNQFNSFIREPMDEKAEAFFHSGLRLYREGRQKEALLAWSKSVQIDPGNYIIRKQIWAITHPDKFYSTVVDFDWQRQQMTTWFWR